MNFHLRTFISSLAILSIFIAPAAEKEFSVTLSEIAPGYSATSVNTTIFRSNSVTSHGKWQYAAYYDPDGYVTIAKRRHGSHKWKIQRSPYKGNVKDAHNVISIGIDGNGTLHAAFDHHGHTLRYCRSVKQIGRAHV